MISLVSHDLVNKAYLFLHNLLMMALFSFWPIFFGFFLSGIINEFVSQEKIAKNLKNHGFVSSIKATFYGFASSSCSFASTNLTKTLINKKAEPVAALIFMFASTNLVLEVFFLIINFFGVNYLIFEIIGTFILVAILSLTGNLIVTKTTRAKINNMLNLKKSSQLGEPRNLSFLNRILVAFDKAKGDFLMIKNEIAFGIIAGSFIQTFIPTSWFRALFLDNHGSLSTVLDAFIGPLVGFLSFMCSEANILLAWVLFSKGVGLSGTLSFIFSDLLILPIILIYFRYFGKKLSARLIGWFYLAIAFSSLFSAFLAKMFNVSIANPDKMQPGSMQLGTLNATLDAVAFFLVVSLIALSRRFYQRDQSLAIDPICNMRIDKATAIKLEKNLQSFYFCSEHCKEAFLKKEESPEESEFALDPICNMKVTKKTSLSAQFKNETYYFCCVGCKEKFSEPHQNQG